MAFKFNPKRITGSWKGVVGGREFSVLFNGGFMDGEPIKVAYNEERVKEHVGFQGDTSILVSANQLATLTLILVQGSPLNDELSRLVGDAKRNYLPVGQMDWSDLNGTTKIKSTDAYIKKVAEVAFGDEIKGREWMFGLPDAEIFVGGASDF